MSTEIHPLAVVDDGVELDTDVVIGPYVVIGPDVEIGSGTRIGPHSVIECNTRIGQRCSIGVGVVLGGAPQDRKFRDQVTWLAIGDDTSIRDYSTINRGSGARGKTSVGSECFIMTYVHVAHDCIIEDHVVLANAVQLAGHVHVEAHATIGGSTPVHQFVRIGTHAFVGGGSRLPQDVPPYTRAAGNPYRLYGINTIGLTRAGFDPQLRLDLKHAYRKLFNSHLTSGQAAEELRKEYRHREEVMRLVDFVMCSDRGVLT